MSGCPMHNRKVSIADSDPYRLNVEQKWKVMATRRDIIRMMRPFYWPGEPGDARSKVYGLRALIVIFVISLFATKLLNILVPQFMGRASNAIALKQDLDAYWNIGYLVSSAFLAIVFNELKNVSYHYIQCVGLSDLSLKIYSHLHELSYQWFIDSRSGETIRSMTRGLESMRELTQFGILTLIPTIVESISVILVFFTYYKNPWLALSITIMLVLYTVVTIYITNWRQRTRMAQMQRDNEMHNISNDGLNNFETVKCYTNEKYEIIRYTNAVKEHEACNWRVLKSLAGLNIIQEFLKQSCVAASLVLSAIDVFNNKDDVGRFVAVQYYLVTLFRPLFLLGTIYSSILRAVAGITDAANLLLTKPTIVDHPEATELHIDLKKDSEHPMIEYKHVYFKYKQDDVAVPCNLSNISFKLPKGSTLAIVGSTGSGKTTIARLLCRFFDVYEGSINVNGIDISRVTQASLRKCIGVVAQDTVLFHASLRDNIKYAKLEATDDEIYEALKQASLYERVMELPQGLDTIVGERGLRLSGGEKQRVSIARCFLKNPPIIILDEATSALDSKTESQIQTTLSVLFKNRTVVTIAHRLCTIVNSNFIILLDGGKIKESGTHDELIQLGGTYKSMWEAQLQSPKHRTNNEHTA